LALNRTSRDGVGELVDSFGDVIEGRLNANGKRSKESTSFCKEAKALVLMEKTAETAQRTILFLFF